MTQLSNATLQNATTDIQFERTQRLVNNISPRVNANRGRTLNDLNTRLLIERLGANGKNIYYCIGCLKSSANKTTDRIHQHAINCKVRAGYIYVLWV